MSVGVAIVMTRYATRIISARIYSIVQVYAPTNDAEDEAKETSYDLLDAVPRRDMFLVMGNWNAKVGERQDGESGIVRKDGPNCERNDNGDRFVTFCASNNLAIT